MKSLSINAYLLECITKEEQGHFDKYLSSWEMPLQSYLLAITFDRLYAYKVCDYSNKYLELIMWE